MSEGREVAALSSVYIPRLLQNDSSLKELDLSGKYVTDLSTNHLAESLKKNTRLTKLDLSGNLLHNDGAGFLADMLMINGTLTELNISSNNIGDEGGRAFIAALQTNSALQKLKFEKNHIHPTIMEQIHYWLDFNWHPPDLKKFIPAVQQNNETVYELDLSGDSGLRIYTELSATIVADALKHNTVIKRVVLDYNFKGDNLVSIVADCFHSNARVQFLSLQGCHVGPEGAKSLSNALLDNTTLKELNLNDNEVGDMGARAFIEALSTNHSCYKITLDNNTLSPILRTKLDAALTLNAQPTKLKQMLPKVVANDLSLVHLDMQGESFTSGQVATSGNAATVILSDALRRNTQVRSLDLSNNHIGPDGAKALAEMLKVNSWLTDINLKNNQIRNEGAVCLVDALKLNDSVMILDVDDNHIEHKWMVAVSTALELNRQPTSLKRMLPMIYDNNSELTDVNFDDLLDNPESAEQQSYKYTRLQDSSAEMLAKALTDNSVVTKLGLRGGKISNHGVKCIAEMLRSNQAITKINLTDNPDINQDGVVFLIAALKVNDTVQEIDLGNRNLVPDEWLNELNFAVQLNHQPVLLKQAMARILDDDPSLRTLAFKNSKAEGPVTDNSCVHLTNALMLNTSVTSLDLSGNAITNRGAEVVAEYLRQNKSLWYLDLSNNDIGIDGADFISRALRTNNTLKRLDLSHNHILEEGGRCLEQMVWHNHALKKLEFSNNNVSVTLSRTIRNAVMMNNQPARLKKILQLALHNDPALREIDMHDFEPANQDCMAEEDKMSSSMDDLSLEVICFCLYQNTWVSSINLSNGTITSASCKYLVELMKRNTHITNIVLSNNKFTDDNISLIVDALKLNNIVVQLNLDDNNLSPFMLNRVNMAIALNSQPRLVKHTCLRMNDLDAVRSIRFNEYDGTRYCDDQTCQVLQYYLINTTRVTSHTGHSPTHTVSHINLANNMITDQGCVYLAALLQENKSILSLNLDNNQITNVGIRNLCKSIQQHNNTLQSVSYMDNDVDDVLLQQQLDTKLKDNSRRAREQQGAEPTQQNRRRKQSLIRVEDTPEYIKRWDDEILAEAMRDSTRMFISTR